MRMIFSILGGMLFLSSFGQKMTIPFETNNLTFELKPISNELKVEPLIYVDSTIVSFETLSRISSNDIEKVKVEKTNYDSITNTKGKIFVTLKKGKQLEIYNFASFKEKFVPDTTKPILLMVNSIFKNNYTTFGINKNSIIEVEIDKGNDILPIKHLYPKNTLVNIRTISYSNLNSGSNMFL